MIEADRLARLQPGIFSEINLQIRESSERGHEIIDLSVGSPDMPPPKHVKQVLIDSVAEDSNYGYTLTEGMQELKLAVASWYAKKYSVNPDPDKEILSLMGSQDGLSHLFLALINDGETVLVPDPGYPIYFAGPLLAGAVLYKMPLLASNDFLPDFAAIPTEVCKKARIMILNYPSNPHAATASMGFFQQAVDFAKEYDIKICHDFAYSELSYDGFKNTSFLQVQGSFDVGVEFHSISKTFNLAGCRLGFVVGNAEMIDALRKLKSNIDYGIFRPVQLAAVAALNGSEECVTKNAMAYQARRDVLIDVLAKYGWSIPKPMASMFIWAKIPEGFSSSSSFCRELLQETGVAIVPGNAFGEHGEGYVRIGLVKDVSTLYEAGKRVGLFLLKHKTGA